MEGQIQKIFAGHPALFGPHPTARRVNTGFTNTIYTVNDSLILKLCTDPGNEPQFQREIAFYKANPDNPTIPRLYAADTSKQDVPWFYEIMEKVEGVSLYHVWHTFDEGRRENIMAQLCAAMKELHREKGKPYDWTAHIKGQYEPLSRKAAALSLFTPEEQALLSRAAEMFEPYLPSKEFVLVHNDLHFDNILYHDGKIRLIDFERALYAPRDLELDILYRMVRKPWKFAGEDTEGFTDPKDYASIMKYVGTYYPELTRTPHLCRRLAIYDMVYFLRQLVDYPQLEELKQDVLTAAQAVLSQG